MDVRQEPEGGSSSKTVAEGLTDAYGLRLPELVFLGGEVDRNYRVATADGQIFLAKLRIGPERHDELQWQKDILCYVADRNPGVAVPTLVRTTSGDPDLRIDLGPTRGLLTVLNWVAGTDMAKVERHSDELLFSIGATAARITDSLTGFRSETLHTTHHWDIVRAGEVIDECLACDPSLGENPDVMIAREWFGAVEPTLGSLPRAMVHNDLNDNNVLVGESDGAQCVAGVLDFNDALYTVRVAEPAIAGAYAMLRKDDPLAAMERLMAGYVSVTPLTDAEIDVAYPLAAARLCMQALTWAVRGRAQPTEYGSMRMRHTVPTLHRVVQVDVDAAAARLRAVAGDRRAD